jgi:PAS domain S-box-containing protein
MATHRPAGSSRQQETRRAGKAADPTVEKPSAAPEADRDLTRLLLGVALAANESAEPQEALQRTLDLVCDHTRWSIGHALSLSDEGDLVSTGVWHGEDVRELAAFRAATESTRFAPGVGLPGRVLEQGRAVWVEDLSAEPTRIRDLPASGVRAALAFPVLAGDRVVGVLEFFAPAPCPPDEALIEIMVSVGAQLGRVIERERAARAVHLSEARLLGIISIAPSGIISLDDDFAIRMFNRSAEAIFEYQADEVIGRSFGVLVARRSWSTYREELRGFLDTEEEVRETAEPRTIRARRKGGDEFNAEMSLSRLNQNGGTSLITIIVDVTERERAAHALRESEERLQFAARASNDVVWDWRVLSGKVWWSDAIERVLRYSPGEVRPSIEWWYDRIHPEDRERVNTGLHRALGGLSESWTEEYRFLRGDGTFATLHDRGYIVRDDRGTAVRLVGSMADVSQRTNAEQAHRLLAKVSGLLTVSFDRSLTFGSVASLIVPTLGDYFLVHEAGEDGALHRLVAAHAVSLSDEVLIAMDREVGDWRSGDDPIRQTIQSGEAVLIPDAAERYGEGTEIIEKTGTASIRSILCLPLIARDRTVGTMTLATAESNRRYGLADLAIAQELAHRLALALDNTELYRKMRDAIQIRDEVLGVVSHDLRNPLHIIRMSAAMLLDTTAERRSGNIQWLQKIDSAVEHMTVMIENLLDSSKLESGTFTLTPDATGLADLLEQALELFRPIAKDRSIALATNVSDVAILWADAGQVLRVLSNLLANALKFTPAGGKVSIKVDRVEDHARFAVSDTGPGIPPDQLDHVFERYWQATKGDRRGAGLGLSIASGIVRAHGGSIWVESRPGEGATFYFTIPLYEGGGTDDFGDEVREHGRSRSRPLPASRAKLSRERSS